MAVVAEEAGIIVVTLYMVGSEVQSIIHVLPIGDQGRHVVVHGQVWVTVDLSPNLAQIPSPREAGISKTPEIEGLGGRNDEEVPHSRIVSHIPIGGFREEDPVIPPTSRIVVFLRR